MDDYDYDYDIFVKKKSDGGNRDDDLLFPVSLALSLHCLYIKHSRAAIGNVTERTSEHLPLPSSDATCFRYKTIQHPRGHLLNDRHWSSAVDIFGGRICLRTMSITWTVFTNSLTIL